MMERVLALIGSVSAGSPDQKGRGVIVSAVCVKEEERDRLKKEAELLVCRFGEEDAVLSHSALAQAMQELVKRGIRIFAVHVEEEAFRNEVRGASKEAFHEFAAGVALAELRQMFPKLQMVFGLEGSNPFDDFLFAYFKQHEDLPNLFSERDFSVERESGALLTAARWTARALSFFDREGSPFEKLLSPSLLRLERFPRRPLAQTGRDGLIAQICLKSAQDFIRKHGNSREEAVLQQVLTLKYLVFRFLNHDDKRYIYTKELIQNLAYHTPERISVQKFRTSIIGRLRDQGVVIASSAKGYKIPSREEELYDFINHGATIIMPMLHRLKLCRDVVKEESGGQIDLFEKSEYQKLRGYLEEK